MLTRFCVGAIPEVFDTFGHGSVIDWGRQYPLRPELAESTYHLYMATKDPKYLNIGRKLLFDIDETSRVTCGYAAVMLRFEKFNTYIYNIMVDTI